MKTFKKYHTEFMYVYLPILAVLCFVAAVLPKLVSEAFYLNGVFLVFLVILFFSPLKTYHRKFKAASVTSYFSEFLKLSLLQLVLMFIAININLIFSTLVPAGHSLSITSTLPQNINNFFHWGLFPWSAILLMGLTLAIYRISMGPNITIRQLTHPVIGKNKDKFLDVGIELFLRQGMIIAASVIVIFFGLSLYFYAVALGAPRIHFKPSGYTVLMYLLIFITISSRFWKGRIKQLWLRNYTTLQIFLFQGLLICLAILILTPALAWFGNTIQVDMSQAFDFPMPHLEYHYAWMLLNWAFWMAMVVVLAPMIANIARNKNIRVVILLGLFWPVVFTVAWLEPSLHSLLITIFKIIEKPKVSLAFNIIMLIGTALYVGFNKSFEALLMRYFYQEKADKQKRYPLKMLANLLKLMTLLFLLYIFAGINLLSLLLFGIIGTCYPIYAFSGAWLLRGLWFKKDYV